MVDGTGSPAAGPLVYAVTRPGNRRNGNPWDGAGVSFSIALPSSKPISALSSQTLPLKPIARTLNAAG